MNIIKYGFIHGYNVKAALALCAFLRKSQKATIYTHRTHKTPGKTSAGQAVRRLALWAERYQKIASLHPLRSCILSILFHP